jgi:cytoskeletal protein RodZ
MAETSAAKIKKARLDKGITLEEAQKKTKIQLNILRAIEGDGLINLSPIYLRSFLKIYCKFLGLDPAEYISEYREPVAAYPAATGASASPAQKRQAGVLVMLRSFALSRMFRKILFFALAATAAFTVIPAAVKAVSRRLKARPAAAAAVVSRRREAPVRAQRQQKAMAALPSAAQTGEEINAPIRLGLRAREDSYVKVVVDGKTFLQGTMKKGLFESWEANEKILLSLGNAAAVEVQVNEQRFPALGRKGQSLKNIIITREGLKVR